MNRSELAATIESEGLDSPILDAAQQWHEDAVVLHQDGASWIVYLVDERPQAISSTTQSFTSEQDALAYVLLKLQHVKNARDAMSCLRARNRRFLGHSRERSATN